MISTVHKCGCVLLNPESYEPCPSQIITKTEKENENVCDCGTNINKEKIKPQLKPIIAKKRLPYKEIEVIINDNQMVLRMQNEGPELEFEPSCDCFPQNVPQSSTLNNEENNEGIYQKMNHGCNTMILYPQQEPRNFENKSDRIEDMKAFDAKEKHSKVKFIDQEENPNIFILKIKKKSQNGDKKYNLDCEFYTARPWFERNTKN